MHELDERQHMILLEWRDQAVHEHQKDDGKPEQRQQANDDLAEEVEADE